MFDHFDARVTYDQDEVTVSIARFGILAFGVTLEDAIADLLVEMNAWAQRGLAAPGRYHLVAEDLALLRRFVEQNPAGQAAMLSREPA